MAVKFELKKAADGQLWFTLKTADGQALLTSEQYKARASAENGIASVQKNAPDDGRYQRKTAKNGEPYFVLTATNGQIIGKSRMCDSVASMESDIALVKQHAPNAMVEDLT